jgi:hypothetical protein
MTTTIVAADLVIGAGDTLVSETDATVIVVDRISSTRRALDRRLPIRAPTVAVSMAGKAYDVGALFAKHPASVH